MRQKVWFQNSKGDSLCGILSDSGTNTQIVILCHGFSSTKDNSTNLRLEEILRKNKISSFRFDFYGHGESDGKFENITISEAVDDVLKSISYLKKRKYKKIALMGGSFGGIASIMAASKTKGLAFLVLKCPVSNYKEKRLLEMSKFELETWKKKGWTYYESGRHGKLRLNYTFFQDFDKNNGYLAAKKIKAPTLIVHGDKDESVPIEQSKKTSRLIKNCKLEIIKGADHRFTNPEHFEKMIGLISGFIIKESRK